MTDRRRDPEASLRAQADAAAELPALLQAVRAADAGPDERLAFWSAIFGLPHWIFIARGSADRPSPFVVYAGADGRTPTLLAFSHPKDAVDVARAAGLPAAEAEQVLAVPMPGAVDWAVSLAESGVQAVQFEAQDAGGLVVPIHQLPQMRADLLGG